MNKIKNLLYKSTDNSLLGLAPIAVFVLANTRLDFPLALLIGFLTSFIVSLLVIPAIGKGKMYSFLFLLTSNATLSVSAALFFIPFFGELFVSFRYILVTEGIFVLNLFLTIVFKQRIQSFFIKIAKLNIAGSMSNSIDEYVDISKIIVCIFAVHLLIAGIYFLLPTSGNLFDVIFVWVFPSIVIAALLLFEYYRLGYLKKKLDAEEWVAVVDEQGRVIGKIAKSETWKMGNKYMHPVVRIAVAHAGRIFLAPRSENMLLDPIDIDHPFEKYVEYGHTLDETAENILKENNIHNLKPRFSIKYLFENKKTKRLIYLYTIENCDENIFNRQKFENGKFWTQKQIEENLSKGFFSECFEKEYEYLKNTLLLFCEREEVI